MFDSLSDRLTGLFQDWRGRSRFTEDNMQASLREVRTALLEADVALSVVQQFVAHIRSKALGLQVTKSLRPGEALIKIVHDELVVALGDTLAELNLKTQPPAIILLAGLQGSGKTTTAAKLAHWLHENQKKSILLASTDVYRPAAMEQLATLAQQINVEYFPATPAQKPVAIAQAALAAAKKKFTDVLIIDTAGRLHVDDAMMTEIRDLHKALNPIETLFVVDSMTGQDAVNTAKAFGDALPLTGVILTKIDGDARGGAALSLRLVTGKPIKFMGVGEKTDAFEPFHPDRIASRILGMGDILTLVEQAQKKIDHEQAAKLAKKIHAGKGFNFEDFLSQLQQMHKMGGAMGLLSKLPGFQQIPQQAKQAMDQKMFTKMEAMIQSMTRQERRFPDVINGSRKKRIAMGSGTEVQDVNRLIKQYTQMQKMMKKFKGGNMMKMMSQMKGMMSSGQNPFGGG